MPEKTNGKTPKMGLPAEIYVRVMNEGDGDPYLLAGASREDVIHQIGDRVEAGYYKLIAKVEINNTTTVEKIADVPQTKI